MLLAIGIGYSVLTDELVTNIGNISITPQTWAVGYTPGSFNGTSKNRGDICGQVTVTSHTASLANHTISNNGRCYYTLTLTNSGTIGAKMGSVYIDTSANACGSYDINSNNGAYDVVCGNLRYTISGDISLSNIYHSGVSIPASNNAMTVYLVVTNTSGSSSTESMYSFDMTFDQN